MIETAVITGAASGIGAALAAHLAANETRVIVADIDMAGAERQADAIIAAGGCAQALFADHAEEASLSALADAAFERFGHVDLVVANAGVGAGGPLFTTPQRNVDWVIAVNLVGPIQLARAFLPRMVAANRPARFAITASEHALGLPSRGGQASIYTVSKHGALAVAETLRRDLAQTQVAVSVICPAIVSSEIWNPLRTRHERFGGPRYAAETLRPDPGQGLPAAIAAERIAEGLVAGEFYVFTHGQEIAEVHGARATEIAAALDRFHARHGSEA